MNDNQRNAQEGILKAFGEDILKSLQYNNDLEFSKTGAEIRAKCVELQTIFSVEIVNLKDKISTLRSEIKEELDLEPTEQYYGTKPNGVDLFYCMMFMGSGQCEPSNNSVSERNQKVSDYNNAVYQLMDKATNLEIVKTIQDNVKDNKEYKLTLATIQDLKF